MDRARRTGPPKGRLAERRAMQFVFAYGSLLNPASGRRTLPYFDERHCQPAHCTGMRRTFGVAFPNDGCQSDKWYADEHGHRPSRILFADLEPNADVTVNGILIPVSVADVERLQIRELRYDSVDLTGRVTLLDGQRPSRRVIAFLGRSEFTQPCAVAAGVVPAAYLESIRAGAHFWECRAPGFDAAFAVSTHYLPPERVRVLTRFDTPPSHPIPVPGQPARSMLQEA